MFSLLAACFCKDEVQHTTSSSSSFSTSRSPQRKSSCSKMTDVTINHEGYLEKRARKSGRNWKKRYFTLQSHQNHSSVLIYREAPGKKEKGRLVLTPHAKCQKSESDKKNNVLEIICDVTNSSGETLFVSASSQNELDKWLLELAIVTSKLKDKHLARASQANLPPPPAGSLSNIRLPGPPAPAASSLPGPPSSKPPPSLSSSSSSSSSSSGETKSDGPPVNPKMWGWGANHDGQIGQSQSLLQNSAQPKHVEALKRKNAPSSLAACGTCHTICVTVNGMLFGFGEGAEGQLGCGDKVSRSSRPYLLASVRKERCVIISSSERHNIAVMEDGTVYAWGTSQRGALGLGSEQHSTMLPTPIPSLGSLAGVSIHRVACGGDHTMFVARSGAVYGCGDNTSGQLGVGHTRDVQVPELLRDLVHTPIADVATGACFTVLSMRDENVLLQVSFFPPSFPLRPLLLSNCDCDPP